jgi:hypothetical protein
MNKEITRKPPSVLFCGDVDGVKNHHPINLKNRKQKVKGGAKNRKQKITPKPPSKQNRSRFAGRKKGRKKQKQFTASRDKRSKKQVIKTKPLNNPDNYRDCCPRQRTGLAGEQAKPATANHRRKQHQPTQSEQPQQQAQGTQHQQDKPQQAAPQAPSNPSQEAKASEPHEPEPQPANNTDGASRAGAAAAGNATSKPPRAAHHDTSADERKANEARAAKNQANQITIKK